MKDPGGFVDEDSAEALGVVGLKALDHELDGGVILGRVSGMFAPHGCWLRTMFARENPVISKTTVCLR